jgi:hypothetical protein
MMKNAPSLAALFSGHPTAPGDPRNQLNNTMNTAGLRPMEIEYRTPYNDNIVRYPIAGVQLVDALATPPRSQFPLTPQQEQALANFPTTTLPMGETGRRGPGNPLAGTDNGINPDMFTGPTRGPRGMNTALRRGPQLRA